MLYLCVEKYLPYVCYTLHIVLVLCEVKLIGCLQISFFSQKITRGRMIQM
jgi:hypothetical protein